MLTDKASGFVCGERRSGWLGKSGDLQRLGGGQRNGRAVGLQGAVIGLAWQGKLERDGESRQHNYNGQVLFGGRSIELRQSLHQVLPITITISLVSGTSVPRGGELSTGYRWFMRGQGYLSDTLDLYYEQFQKLDFAVEGSGVIQTTTRTHIAKH